MGTMMERYGTCTALESHSAGVVGLTSHEYEVRLLMYFTQLNN